RQPQRATRPPRAEARHCRLARLSVLARPPPPRRAHGPSSHHPRGPLERQSRGLLGPLPALAREVALQLAAQDVLDLPPRVPAAVRPARPRAPAHRAPPPAARGGGVAREHRLRLT